MPTCHYVNLPLCQLAIMSTCHYVNLPFCQIATMFTFHLVSLPLCQLVILLACHFVYFPLCHLSILPTCHFVNLPLCQLSIMQPCHYVNWPLCQLDIMSTFHYANLPLCQLTSSSLQKALVNLLGKQFYKIDSCSLECEHVVCLEESVLRLVYTCDFRVRLQCSFTVNFLALTSWNPLNSDFAPWCVFVVQGKLECGLQNAIQKCTMKSDVQMRLNQHLQNNTRLKI
jgi:hypothetical protein